LSGDKATFFHFTRTIITKVSLLLAERDRL
jgi:hypothetical protein